MQTMGSHPLQSCLAQLEGTTALRRCCLWKLPQTLLTAQEYHFARLLHAYCTVHAYCTRTAHSMPRVWSACAVGELQEILHTLQRTPNRIFCSPIGVAVITSKCLAEKSLGRLELARSIPNDVPASVPSGSHLPPRLRGPHASE